MSAVAQDIFSSGRTQAADGSWIKASSHISREQGEALASLIANDSTISKTLEVGCAQGVSSLYICEALRSRDGARHRIIDPFQMTGWQGAGLRALERAGLDNFDFMSERSEFVLPRLCESGEKLDLIFLDGWHTFDQVMTECFYATRILRVGGYLALDDVDSPSLAKLSKYISRYDCYQVVEQFYAHPVKGLARMLTKVGAYIPVQPNLSWRLPKTLRKATRGPRMTIFQKIKEDERPSYWYAPF